MRETSEPERSVSGLMLLVGFESMAASLNSSSLSGSWPMIYESSSIGVVLPGGEYAVEDTGVRRERCRLVTDNTSSL